MIFIRKHVVEKIDNNVLYIRPQPENSFFKKSKIMLQ